MTFGEIKKCEHLTVKYFQVCLAKSAVFKNVPEKSGVIRVKDYMQRAVLCSDGKKGTKGKILLSCAY